jgi:hypothetical protein
MAPTDKEVDSEAGYPCAVYPGNCKEDDMTTYSVYYTDLPLPKDARPDLSLLVPLNYLSRDEALEEAFKLIYEGAVVWKIEGPQGLTLDRAEVEKAYMIFKNT